jgi:hypothetical protein
MGQPSKLTPHQQREALKWRANGETLVDIARRLDVNVMESQQLEQSGSLSEDVSRGLIHCRHPLAQRSFDLRRAD